MALSFVSDVSGLSSVAVRPLGAQTGITPTNVACGSLKDIGIVLETTDPRVAVSADKTANASGRMAMVDMKAGSGLAIAGFVGTADRANAALVCEDCIILGESNAVVVAKVLFRFVVWVFCVAGCAVFSLFFRAIAATLSFVDAVTALPHQAPGLHAESIGGFGSETSGALAHGA